MSLTNAEIRKKYVARNPVKFRESVSRYRKKLRSEVIDLLGGVCKNCGFSDKRALQIDHILGGGKKEILSFSGAHYLNRIKKSIKSCEQKYQILCANCNWIKRSENNEVLGRPKIMV